VVAWGSRTVKRQHGLEFYAEIGRRGGETVKMRHGPDYYAQIGRKGGESARRLRTKAPA
jgi:general stress protein YciG